MTRMDCGEETPETQIAVFLKGKTEHVTDLISFLNNQNFKCTRLSDREREHMEEMAFFDDGFFVMTNGEPWSFHELRNFIQTYANTWEEDYMLRHSLIETLLTCDEAVCFDDAFYVEMAKQVDACEDRYYLAGKETSQFFDGIQKLLCNNLKLYWVATEFIDHGTKNLSYLNHVPSSLPKTDISEKIASAGKHKIIEKDIVFDGELLARIHLCPGPFSPKKKLIHEFTDYVIMHIDDFVYGIISHQREIHALQKALAGMSGGIPVRTEEDELRDKRSMKILLLGVLHISESKALSIFREHGFSDVKMITEWEKIKKQNANDLLKARGRYDGIILGQMPHKTKNADNLISRFETEPDRYPPHVIIKTKSENLKITKSSLKDGLKELQPKLEETCCML